MELTGMEWYGIDMNLFGSVVEWMDTPKTRLPESKWMQAYTVMVSMAVGNRQRNGGSTLEIMIIRLQMRNWK